MIGLNLASIALTSGENMTLGLDAEGLIQVVIDEAINTVFFAEELGLQS